MATLKCEDGTVVQISAETERNLWKAFGKPEHVWEHGDVFDNGDGDKLIYLNTEKHGIVVQYLLESKMLCTPSIQLHGATFLFNIKDKL